MQHLIALRIELASELSQTCNRIKPMGELAAFSGLDRFGQSVITLRSLDDGFHPPVELVSRQVDCGDGQLGRVQSGTLIVTKSSGCSGQRVKLVASDQTRGRPVGEGVKLGSGFNPTGISACGTGPN